MPHPFPSFSNSKSTSDKQQKPVVPPAMAQYQQQLRDEQNRLFAQQQQNAHANESAAARRAAASTIVGHRHSSRSNSATTLSPVHSAQTVSTGSSRATTTGLPPQFNGTWNRSQLDTLHHPPARLPAEWVGFVKAHQPLGRPNDQTAANSTNWCAKPSTASDPNNDHYTPYMQHGDPSVEAYFMGRRFDVPALCSANTPDIAQLPLQENLFSREYTTPTPTSYANTVNPTEPDSAFIQDASATMTPSTYMSEDGLEFNWPRPGEIPTIILVDMGELTCEQFDGKMTCGESYLYAGSWNGKIRARHSLACQSLDQSQATPSGSDPTGMQF